MPPRRRCARAGGPCAGPSGRAASRRTASTGRGCGSAGSSAGNDSVRPWPPPHSSSHSPSPSDPTKTRTRAQIEQRKKENLCRAVSVKMPFLSLLPCLFVSSCALILPSHLVALVVSSGVVAVLRPVVVAHPAPLVLAAATRHLNERRREKQTNKQSHRKEMRGDTSTQTTQPSEEHVRGDGLCAAWTHVIASLRLLDAHGALGTLLRAERDSHTHTHTHRDAQ